MLAIDANFSLKRMALNDRKEGDVREFHGSDYYLSAAEIARYENEVKSSSRRSSDEEPEDESEPVNPLIANEGDATDGLADSGVSACAARWKAAQSDETKKMWPIFQESGLFASACRHGFILWIADLIQSGELYVTLYQLF